MNGSELIAKERIRQVEEEDYDVIHDGQHKENALAEAAVCYIMCKENVIPRHVSEISPGDLFTGEGMRDAIIWALWPWGWKREWFKPKTRIRNLVRAGALIAAEIDRLQALENGK